MIDFLFWMFVVACFSHLVNGPLQEPEQILAWKPRFIKWVLSFGKAKPLQQYSFNGFQKAVITVFSVCPKCLAFWVSLSIYPCIFNLELYNYFAFITLSVYTTFIFSEKIFYE